MNYKIKNIYISNQLVAKIFKYQKKNFKGIKFFTKSHYNFQIGLMAHPKNHIIQPHSHINKRKIIKDMSELLILFSGKLKVYFYKKKIFYKSIILRQKDMILLLSGAHGFKVLEKLEMIEVKQGPFTGDKDKIKLKTKK